MLTTNWHTHTKRCGHAVGEEEEYVVAAIHAGLKTLGFSEHAAYPVPDPTEHMPVDEISDYFRTVRILKEKYKDQIDIHLGMEVEYYPDQWGLLSRYRKETEYCILGQHSLTFRGKSSYRLKTPEHLKEYADKIEEACRHGLCDMIAHPDVALYSYPVIDEAVIYTAERLAEISLRYDIPLELNAGSGVQRGLVLYDDGPRYPYPVRAFFEVFAKHQCKIVPGLDIHDPNNFFTDKWLDRAFEVVEGLSCNIIEDYDIITPAKKRKQEFR